MATIWSINGRFVTQPFSGVQRYAHEIVRELDELVSEGHPLADNLILELLVPPHAQNLPQLKSIQIRCCGRGGGHGWEQTMLPSAVRGGLLSLCNTGPVVLSEQIICLHDVNTRVYPESYSFAFRAFYRILLPVLGRRAKLVTTVSHYSADELARYGITAKKQALVIPDGHEHAKRWQPEHSVKTRAVAGRNTVLAIGSPAPHKNIGLLLGLADEFRKAGLRLAIAGLSDSRVFQTLSHDSCATNVAWLGKLSDNEIAAMLNDSLCLAFPSFVEGFGLPAVEAMAWGCPVVASDRASLPEICGDAALYASPTDPVAWRDQIIRLARDPALAAVLVEKGRTQVKRFSWRRSAELYLQAMQNAA